jgi:streptogramin lyase
MHRPVIVRPGALLGCVIATILGLAGPAAAVPAAAHRTFPIPTPNSQPIEITRGSDGNMWFTESGGQRVARITPQGAVTEFGFRRAFPDDITLGSDGAVWFTLGPDGMIGRITPDGQILGVRFDAFDAAGGITNGPDGNIWFTDQTGAKVWRLDLVSHKLTSFPVPAASFLTDITTGPDGNLWFTDVGLGTVDRMTPQGTVTEFGGGSLESPFAIAAGPDGNVWFTERFAGRVDKITPAGVITPYAVPGNVLDSIQAGPDANLWFTESGSDRIARISTGGVVTEAPTLPGSMPTGLAIGPRQTVWFLGYGTNSVYATSIR